MSSSLLVTDQPRSAQIQAYSAYRLLRGAKELTEILPSTGNATAQPGRSLLCRREALLPLARSYRMKGMPRAGLHCCIHRRSIAVRIVMMRRREEGGELSSCSISVNAMPSRGMIAVATVKRIESRVADRGFWLQTGRAVKAFSCGRTSEPAVVTLDTTTVPCLLARSCMNNTLLRESIWWRCMMGSMLIRSAKR